MVTKKLASKGRQIIDWQVRQVREWQLKAPFRSKKCICKTQHMKWIHIDILVKYKINRK